MDTDKLELVEQKGLAQFNSFVADTVAWAYQSGITTGISSTAFDPNASVTREQLVTFFARYTAMSGISVEAQAGSECLHRRVPDQHLCSGEHGLGGGDGLD